MVIDILASSSNSSIAYPSSKVRKANESDGLVELGFLMLSTRNTNTVRGVNPGVSVISRVFPFCVQDSIETVELRSIHSVDEVSVIPEGTVISNLVSFISGLKACTMNS